MTGWQPIETAPKDGQVIVAMRRRLGFRGYTLIFWDSANEEWAGYTAEHEKVLVKHQPTDWAPLPPDPETANGG